jgi:glycosyltransferase involved in cell wall biosynthesis
MEIAFLTETLIPNTGWGRHSIEIISRMQDHGISPVVFTERSKPTPANLPFPVHSVLRSRDDKFGKSLLARIDGATVRRLSPKADAIFSMAEPLGPASYFAAAGKIPLFLMSVGTYSIIPLQTRWAGLYESAMQYSSSIIAISRYTATRIKQRLPNISDKVEVGVLGVNVTESSATLPKLEEREFAFLTVGNIKPRKGTLEAVKALSLVVKDYPQAKLYVTSEPSRSAYTQSIAAFATSAGISKNVIWAGRRIPESELFRLFRLIRGFVLPSINAGDHFEGFGLVHIEANSFGVPSIGSLGCGNEDSIVHEQTGFLVPQGDVRELANRMKQLLFDDTLWNKMSSEGIRFSKAMSWDHCAKRYAEIIKRRMNRL